jgi:hypothetical protein
LNVVTMLFHYLRLDTREARSGSISSAETVEREKNKCMRLI